MTRPSVVAPSTATRKNFDLVGAVEVGFAMVSVLESEKFEYRHGGHYCAWQQSAAG
jgi:hypothetical protein